jgi:hypothetical protein
MSAPTKSPSALTQRSCLLAAKCTGPEDGRVVVGVKVRVRKIKKGREIKQQKQKKRGRDKTKPDNTTAHQDRRENYEASRESEQQKQRIEKRQQRGERQKM